MAVPTQGYWAIEACGWVACPGVTDALATPWSVHGSNRPRPVRPPVDGHGVLRTPRPTLDLPEQRLTAPPRLLAPT